MTPNINIELVQKTIDKLVSSKDFMDNTTVSDNNLTEIANLIRVRDLAELSNSKESGFNINFVSAATKSSKFRLAFATTNPNKLKEFIEYTKTDKVFKTFKNCFKVKDSILERVDVPEGEFSFAYNAGLKSKFYSKEYKGSMILSEDSGIIVPCLGFYPGVISARHGKTLESLEMMEEFYSEKQMDILSTLPDDSFNNMVLLTKIYKHYESTNEYMPLTVNAILSTTASLSIDGKEIANHTGTINGVIFTSYMKSFASDKSDNNFHRIVSTLNGFGYNPIFKVRLNHDSAKFVSLEETENAFIHRRNAFNQVLLDLLYKTILPV